MKNIVTMLLISSLLIISACKPQPDLKKDMVQFDKYLIDVWMAIELDDMPQARESFIPLIYTWYHFNKKYQTISTEDDDWQESLRLVNDWLYDMAVSLEWNDRYLAMIQIDHVIYQMMEIRRRHKIDYHLDYVWDFQMAHLILEEATKTDVLHLIEWNEYKYLVRYFNKEWRKLKHCHIDSDLMAWEKQEKELFKQKEKEMDQLIGQFTHYVNKREYLKIKTSFKHIGPELLSLIKMFGNAPDEIYGEKVHYVLKEI